MSINVACPKCGRQYSVREEAAGKRFKCKNCETVIEVPAGGGRGDVDFNLESYGEPNASTPTSARRRKNSAADAAALATANKTKLPAIIMYVVCGISIGAWVCRFVVREFIMEALVPGIAHLNAGGAPVGRGPDIAIDVLMVFRDLFIIYAFSRLQAVRSYSIAFAGAVVSAIPCVGSPCCVLGMPCGVWALVLLNDPAVKEAFR